jgi:hypothetical protein
MAGETWSTPWDMGHLEEGEVDALAVYLRLQALANAGRQISGPRRPFSSFREFGGRFRGLPSFYGMKADVGLGSPTKGKEEEQMISKSKFLGLVLSGLLALGGGKALAGAGVQEQTSAPSKTDKTKNSKNSKNAKNNKNSRNARNNNSRNARNNNNAGNNNGRNARNNGRNSNAGNNTPKNVKNTPAKKGQQVQAQDTPSKTSKKPMGKKGKKYVSNNTNNSND